MMIAAIVSMLGTRYRRGYKEDTACHHESTNYVSSIHSILAVSSCLVVCSGARKQNGAKDEAGVPCGYLARLYQVDLGSKCEQILLAPEPEIIVMVSVVFKINLNLAKGLNERV